MGNRQLAHSQRKCTKMRKLIKSEIKESENGRHYVVDSFHEQCDDETVVFKTRIRPAEYLNFAVRVSDATKEIINKINLNTKKGAAE
jgi:hypothetical protein